MLQLFDCKFMFSILFLVSAGGIISGQAEVGNLNEIEIDKIVPDVIDKTPSAILRVTYGEVKVNLGNIITPTQAKDEPFVTWPIKADTFYTVCMVDPDTLSRQDPNLREAQHWLVVNIPGNIVSEGQVLTEYIGAASPPGTGLHRHTFLLYEQPSKLKFDEERITKYSGVGRPKFSIRNFAKKYNFGEPIAVNFYQAEWDDYVPTLYKQLGVNIEKVADGSQDLKRP